MQMMNAIPDGKRGSKVFINFAKALKLIKNADNLTFGDPKIVYLTGWQYNGHDDIYPAFFEVNKALIHPQDKDAKKSLLWLMREAKKYHTTVSLHINMANAYNNSMLRKEYVKNDLISKNVDVTLRKGEWGYPISYAQKRIDSICQLLPLQKAGTVHIDAFHTWPPIPLTDENGNYHASLDASSTSPYLNFTAQAETEAQRNIFKYWASRGVDVTSEGADLLRETTFEGYQPMAWWDFDGGLTNYLKWPASYYCGGKDNSVWGKLFGVSMQGEEIVKKDKINLTEFKEDFCLKTVIWYYLNKLTRLYVLNTNEYKAVQFSENVRTFYSKGLFKVTRECNIG